jgi:hypothetical protein
MDRSFQYKGTAGCVSASDPEDAGFTRHRFTSRSIDDCANIAKKGGIMCSGGTCSYFVFTSRTIDNKLREAKAEHDKGNQKTALAYLIQAWKSLNPDIRKDELLKAEKVPGSFLNGFGLWATKNSEVMNQLKRTENDPTMPLPLEGNCYVGGADVISNPSVHLSSELDGMSSAETCKYSLFELPGDQTKGNNIQQKMVNMYKRRVAKQKKDLENMKKKLMKDQVALEVAQKNTTPSAMIAEIYLIEKDLKEQEKKKPYLDKIREKKSKLEQSLQGAKLFNYMADTTKKAIYSSNKLLKEKKNALQKLKADIDNINWSIQKTTSQEHLQKMITVSLSIIAVLFVVLCTSLLIYYLVFKAKGSPFASLQASSNSLKNAKNNSSALKSLGSIFNSKKPKGGIPGSVGNKTAIHSIFNV